MVEGSNNYSWRYEDNRSKSKFQLYDLSLSRLNLKIANFLNEALLAFGKKFGLTSSSVSCRVAPLNTQHKLKSMKKWKYASQWVESLFELVSVMKRRIGLSATQSRSKVGPKRTTGVKISSFNSEIKKSSSQKSVEEDMPELEPQQIVKKPKRSSRKQMLSKLSKLTLKTKKPKVEPKDGLQGVKDTSSSPVLRKGADDVVEFREHDRTISEELLYPPVDSASLFREILAQKMQKCDQSGVVNLEECAQGDKLEMRKPQQTSTQSTDSERRTTTEDKSNPSMESGKSSILTLTVPRKEIKDFPLFYETVWEFEPKSETNWHVYFLKRHLSGRYARSFLNANSRHKKVSTPCETAV